MAQPTDAGDESAQNLLADLLADVRAGIVGEVVDQHPTVRDEATYDAVVAASREAVASGLGPASIAPPWCSATQ